MNDKLRGVIVPAASPFEESGKLRPDWFEANMARWSSTKVRGVMTLGSNGEFRSLDDNEARTLVSTAAAVKGDMTLIAGVGRESTYLTLKFIDSIGDHAGAVDYVAVLPPHFFAKSMTADVLHRYYTDIADRSPFKVLIYVVPGYSNGVVVPPETVSALADHPNIVGIKDTSPDQLASYMQAAGHRDDFDVLPGTITTVLSGIRQGGRGCVASAANYFPDECADVVDLALQGRHDEARTAYAELQQLISTTGGIKGVSSLKACMNQLGYRAGVPRAPLPRLSADEERSLASSLEAAGKLNSSAD